MHPVTRRISGKRFINCELVGPANLILLASRSDAFTISGAGFLDCDIVVLKDEVRVFNAIGFEDCTILGGAIMNCTICVFKPVVPIFSALNANFISLTGDQEIDSRLPLSTEP